MLIVFRQAMASNFYRKRDSPRYFLGHGLALGFIFAGFIATIVLIVGYRKINAQRQRRLGAGEFRHYTLEQLSIMGDKAPTFRYMY